MNSRALRDRAVRRRLAWGTVASLSVAACGLTLDEVPANDPGADAGSSSGVTPSGSSSGAPNTSSSSGAPNTSSSSGEPSTSSSSGEPSTSSSSGEPSTSSSSSGGASSSGSAPEPTWGCAPLTAQTPYVPLALVGHNADVIAENTPIADATSRALDGSNYVLFADTFEPKGEPTNYRVGVKSEIVVPGRPIRFALRPDTLPGASSSNNALVLSAQGPSGSLSVSQPKRVSAVAVVWLATGGAKTVSARLSFANGVYSEWQQVTVLDWVASGSGLGGATNFVAAEKLGRVSRTAPGVNSPLDVQGEAGTNVRLSGSTLSVPTARCGDELMAVEFRSALDSPGNGPVSALTRDTVAVFAISAVDSVSTP